MKVDCIRSLGHLQDCLTTKEVSTVRAFRGRGCTGVLVHFNTKYHRIFPDPKQIRFVAKHNLVCLEGIQAFTEWPDTLKGTTFASKKDPKGRWQYEMRTCCLSYQKYWSNDYEKVKMDVQWFYTKRESNTLFGLIFDILRLITLNDEKKKVMWHCYHPLEE